MKTHSLLLLFSNFLIFQSCTTVMFEEPQPSDQPNLETIPTALTGKFLNLEDSSVFTVDAKLAIREYLMTVCEPRNKIDSMFTLTSDTFLIYNDTLRSTTLQVKAQIINDTVCARFTYSDTVFNLSENNVLRKYKDNYFMSVREPENEGWEVIKLQRHKNKLYVATISSKEDVRKLRQITETTDTAQTVFNPTPLQFKKFVRKKEFGNVTVLVRMQ